MDDDEDKVDEKVVDNEDADDLGTPDANMEEDALDVFVVVDVVPFDIVDDVAGELVDARGVDTLVTCAMGMVVDDDTDGLLGTAEEAGVVAGLEVVVPAVVVGPHIPQYLEQYRLARTASWHILYDTSIKWQSIPCLSAQPGVVVTEKKNIVVFTLKIQHFTVEKMQTE